VRDLRNQPGAGIGVHASISVARALLAAGLVDKLRLVIAGSGRKLLDGLPAIRLEPIRSTISPAGHLLAGYRVIGQASSPPRQPGSAAQYRCASRLTGRLMAGRDGHPPPVTVTPGNARAEARAARSPITSAV
jgi:hypothetical protein